MTLIGNKGLKKMKQKLLLVCAAMFIVGCSQEMEVSFYKSVGNLSLAEEQVGEVIDEAGDYTYDMSWSEGKLLVKLSSENGLSRDQAEALAEQVKLELMPEEIIRPVLEIEITETDEEMLEFLSLENGERYSTQLSWPWASVDVFYIDTEGPTDNMRARKFMCAIHARASEPLPQLSASYRVFDIEVPKIIEHTKSISQLEQKFFDQTQIEIDGKDVYIIVGDMGQDFVSQTGRQREYSIGVSAPADANRSNCYRMIEEMVEGDLNGLLPGRAARYNVSRTQVN